MQIDPDAIPPSLGLAGALFIPAAMGKFIGVAAPALAIVRRLDAVLLGVSMIPRAEITMVIVYQCRQLGDDIVPNNVFAAIVLVAVITSVFAPLVLRSMLVKQPPS